MPENDDKYLALLQTVVENQQATLEAQAQLKATIDAHIAHEEEAIKKWTLSLPVRTDGSPDVEGHRDFHQAYIEEAVERKKLFREMRTELAKKGILALLGVLGALFMFWWKHEVKG